MRPTTLDIPGLTKSKVSPDGRIAQEDIGSKLIIVMVGLPARGKSYITKKTARYLNWLQHDTKIFNVGERRRVAASGAHTRPSIVETMKPDLDALRRKSSVTAPTGIIDRRPDASRAAAQILINGEAVAETSPLAEHDGSNTEAMSDLKLPEPTGSPTADVMDQSASFFDPSNRKAALLREQVALETLDELIDYICNRGGAIGILDATNSTLERRKLIMRHIRNKLGDEINVLFVESLCLDQELLETNMRLKLSGPDYKGKDPEKSLADFRKRCDIYAKNYVPLGDYEERNHMPYVQMIDVGRKIISHQIKGFLSAQTVYYLLNFNLAPRQIWITRHGQSQDNVDGKIGGDSALSPSGWRYAQALPKFLTQMREQWEVREAEKQHSMHLPPTPGDTTPPNPYFCPEHLAELRNKNFCVWTSMLQRSIQSASYFDEEAFEVKQMRPLNELYAGTMEGLSYDEISKKYPEEYQLRRHNKLMYRYPGPGGEGYLDVINRLRPLIVELERMTDHGLLIGHRSIVRVLLAYFLGLDRSDITDVSVPLGMLYCLEPKPYGVDLKAYKYDEDSEWFTEVPDFKIMKQKDHLVD